MYTEVNKPLWNPLSLSRMHSVCVCVAFIAFPNKDDAFMLCRCFFMYIFKLTIAHLKFKQIS